MSPRPPRDPELWNALDTEDEEATPTGMDPESTVKLPILRLALPRGETSPVLRVVAGPDMLKFVCLVRGEPVTIGRDESCTLVLSDHSVSRHHTTLQWLPSGEFILEDNRSLNGTRLNGRDVRWSPVCVDDHIEVGRVSLRLALFTSDEITHLGHVVDRLTLSEGKDPLTGLRHRAWFDQELPALVQTWKARRYPVTCTFLDVDHFKRINDTFGHQTGDEVLRTVARLSLLECRDSDACFRYGGEELVFLLPGTDGEGGREQSSRLRRAINDWARTASGLTSVTVSIGVSQLRADDTPATWVHRADQAMYEAKRLGRNRVVLT